MANRLVATSVHVIVDTPRGSRNKFKFDPQLQRFRLAKVLPAGMCFPFDFGYVPETAEEDGDPVDVLVLMEAPAFVGCLVECRLVGVLEAEQAEGDEVVRNDRLIGVATEAREFCHVHELKDLNSQLLDEIEQFFENYNAAAGKRFTVLSRKGPAAARTLLQRASVR
jgi:inorganic pyrophosphatase